MNPKVLIVEDETPLLSLYELILTNREVGGVYDVRTAASAEDALEIAARETFDVLLTDYRMPGRDGISLLQEIRAAHPQTQCLLISGFVDAALVRQALEAGARSCLRKPCSMQEMLQAVGDAARAAAEAPEAGTGQPTVLTLDRIGEVLEANLLHTFFIDSDYVIRQTNGSFRTEYGPCEGRKCHEVLGEAEAPCPGCQAVAAVEARSAKTVTRPGRSPEGKLLEIEERVEPWFEPGGSPRGLLVSFSPILATEETPPPRRRAGRAAATPDSLATTAPNLRARAALGWVEPSQALGVLSASIARLLEGRAAEKPQAADALREVADQLRAFVGGQDAPARPFDDLNAVVVPVLNLAREALGAAGLGVVMNLSTDLPRVRFARATLEQALLDLVLAIAAAKAGERRGEMTFASYAGPECVCLSVGLAGCTVGSRSRADALAPFGAGLLFGGEEGLTLAVIRELLASQEAALDLAPPAGAAGGGAQALATIRLPLARDEEVGP